MHFYQFIVLFTIPDYCIFAALLFLFYYRLFFIYFWAFLFELSHCHYLLKCTHSKPTLRFRKNSQVFSFLRSKTKLLQFSYWLFRCNFFVCWLFVFFSWKHAEQKLIINIKIFYYNHIIVLTPHNIICLFLCVKSLVCLCFCFGCIFSLKWNQWKELVHKWNAIIYMVAIKYKWT